MFRGEFLGLSLFCYNEPLEDGPEARAGYAGLRDQLNRYLGRPIEEWGTPTEPASLWRSAPLAIDMTASNAFEAGSWSGRATPNDRQPTTQHTTHDSQINDRAGHRGWLTAR